MGEWSRFELAGHVFTASLPDSDAEAQIFAIRVLRGDVEIRNEAIPLLYPPVFGPDVSDVRALDERVEEIIKELGLA
jgi:hypothetical protein